MTTRTVVHLTGPSDIDTIVVDYETAIIEIYDKVPSDVNLEEGLGDTVLIQGYLSEASRFSLIRALGGEPPT